MKAKTKAKKGTTLRVLRFVAKYRFSLAVSIICAALSSVLALYIPILTGNAIDAAAGKGAVNFDALKEILIKFIICLAIIVPSQWIMALCNNRVAFGVVRDLRLAAFRKMQKLPISYIDSTARGDTVSRIISALPKGQTYKIQVRSYKNVSGVGSFYSAWSVAQYVTL